MEENKKSPECELEALKQLKRLLFLDYWAYDCGEKNKEKFLRAIKYLGPAGYLDEAECFCELCNEYATAEELERFWKDYFGV